MPRRTAWRAAITVTAVLAACGGGVRGRPSSPTPTPEPPPPIRIGAGESIVVGISAALSGDQAVLGADIADAAELAVREYGAIRGHAVTSARVDDGCTDAEQAVAAAKQLVGRSNFAGVIGPMCTTGAQAANKVFEAAGAVHITPSATRVELSAQGEQYFFRTAWRDDLQAMTQAEYATSTLAATDAAVIDDGEAYGEALADEFMAAFESRGGRTTRDRIKRGTTDFTSIARRMAGAKPDVVVYEGLNPEGALVAGALKSAGYGGTFVGPDAILNARGFIGPGNNGADGAIVTGGPAPDDAFVERFRAAFQRAPSTPFVLQSYDAATVLLKAIDATAVAAGDGSLAIDRQQLAQYLRSERYTGLTGPIAFDERGDRRGDSPRALGLTIYQVKDGRFQPVE